MKAPIGYQLISEAAIDWLYKNHPDAYSGFYKRISEKPKRRRRTKAKVTSAMILQALMDEGDDD